MANLVLASNNKAMGKLDGSVKNKVMDFFEKLNADDTAPGLHVEPIKGSVDQRVRTARVDLNYRAVLFLVDNALGDKTYIYMGTWPHDEANKRAEKATLRVNPINGALEGILGELDGDDDRKKRVVIPNHSGELDRIADPVKQSYLEVFGYTLEDLTNKLGLDPVLAAQAMAAANEDEVLTLGNDAVAWQGAALLELITGTHVDEILTKLALTDGPIDPSLDENEQILEALERPASKMQFVYVDDNEELRRVIESGDFGAWRTFLHPEQRTYVEKDQNGAFRLSGGAGTGKTVVAIHRARHLSRRNPDARIILTTYNKTLALGLKADLKALDPTLELAAKPGDPGVYVSGIDALAKAVVDQASNLPAATGSLLGASVEVGHGRTRTDQVWREVIGSGGGLDARLATPAFLDNEYVSVVLANRITTLEQYAKVARPGRGVRLTRPQRIAVWKLVEAYRRHSRMDGTLSFPEILALAAESLQLRTQNTGKHLADHVLVDEAQDLHATHWALLRAFTPEGPNDLFIAEDSHQRIYGQPVVLGRLGIKIVGRSRRLTLNYRTTAQNLRFAVGILSGAEYKGLLQDEESSDEYRSARLGPDPKLIACKSIDDELNKVADLVKTWLVDTEPESIAVLTRSKDDRGRFVRALGERGVDARALDDNPATAGHVQVLTMHRAKGMEFSRVILAGVDEAHVPALASLRSVPEEEKDEALLRERSLLYVAASRARDALVVTWSGTRTTLIPNANTKAV